PQRRKRRLKSDLEEGHRGEAARAEIADAGRPGQEHDGAGLPRPGALCDGASILDRRANRRPVRREGCPAAGTGWHARWQEAQVGAAVGRASRPTPPPGKKRGIGPPFSPGRAPLRGEKTPPPTGAPPPLFAPPQRKTPQTKKPPPTAPPPLPIKRAPR